MRWNRPAWLPPTFEGPEVTGVVTRRGRRGHGTAGRHARRRRRRRSVGERRRRRVRSSPGTVALSLGTSGVVFAATTEPLSSPRPRPRVLPRGAGALAPDVGDALGGR